MVQKEEESEPILKVDTKSLNADIEMRRMFGSRVVNENDGGRRKAAGKKSTLTTPKDNWPPITKTGISMEYAGKGDDCLSRFKFTHSRTYREAHFHFLDCLNTHDPQNIMALLRVYPFHLDSLIQMSEVYKHTGDVARAGDTIEQVLHQFEKAFHVLFNLSSESTRLPYLEIENRAFYLSLFRHLNFISRKGCWKTSFELSKMLLSLDAENDPMAMLLIIDYFALKAPGGIEWLIRANDEWKNRKGLRLLPNWMYSAALAKWLKQKEEGKEKVGLLML
jgi:hypothetical protein